MKVLNWVVAVALAGALCGCNTVEGLGKDVQEGGEAIEKSAQ